MTEKVKKLTSLIDQMRRVSAISHDIISAIFAWIFAFLLRFNFQIPPEFYASILDNGFWVIPIQVGLFFYFGLYRGVWRFASLPDLKRIIHAVITASLIIFMIKVMFTPVSVIPRSVLVLNPILLIMLMGGSRFIYRAWKDHHLYSLSNEMGKPVLVLGSGEVVMTLLDVLSRSHDWRVVGVLDDQSNLHDRELKGVRVLGAVNDLSKFAQETGVENVILAFPQEKHLNQRSAIKLANELELNVLTIPSIDDLISGKLSVSQIRKVEVEDLLGRSPVSLDNQGLGGLIQARTVMITGAAGSIGSELCRQILRFEPEVLLCIDISEYALYQLEQEFSANKITPKIRYIVADVKNQKRVDGILKQYRPTMVFHAAAYKHVPMMENENVVEALFNNVFGTYQLAHNCRGNGVEKFVLISTDKAVNPTNVMGASKRLAEMVCQGLQRTEGTKFVIVRFGNVLGSSGSVIPKFREQIAHGGPVTVTHPDITRYFMSIPEATQLVMQAGLMGTGGEIFVLDMGEPVRIADLARDMIKLSGFHIDEVAIEYTGLRPGEKLYEELLADDEHTLTTPHPKLRIAQAKSVDQLWVEKLLVWLDGLFEKDEPNIKQDLRLWVEEYVGDINAKSSIVTQSSKPNIVNAPNSNTIH